MAGFWESDLVKNFEKGKLPTVETSVMFDTETIAIAIMLFIIAMVIIFIMYKVIVKK